MPSSTPWAPYAPDAPSPWNLRRVVHLHRRAGFAGTWEELQRDLKDGPSASIERVLRAGSRERPEAVSRGADATPLAEFASIADLLADSAVASGDLARLKAWWFYRMLFGPDPLGEKLTLLWHDHFATANSKVQEPSLMRRQNDTLRRQARGKFADLLNASVREPALLLYLDAQANRKGHPNENLGRELMELFTLGVGHYSETDVKEAARALTGWTVEEGQFADVATRHDDRPKTILGKTGNWAGQDLVNILLQQPAVAERIATKLCRLFFGDQPLPQGALLALAADLREHDLDVGRAVSVILHSEWFFAEENLGTRVLSPVEFVVGAVQALEMLDPAPSTLALADWSARIGQDLFEPPNVGGWPGGRNWVHTRSTIARSNFATALVSGPNVGRPSPYDAAALAHRYGFGDDPASMLTFHYRLLFGIDPPADLRRQASGDNAPMIARLLSSPEAQLG